MGRQQCLHLSLILTDFIIQERVTNKQQSLKGHCDSNASICDIMFTIGDTILFAIFLYHTGKK